jgi:hypothetical protein
MKQIIDQFTANWLAIYCSAIGAIMVAIALWLFLRRIGMATGLRAQGQIIAYREMRKQHVGQLTRYQPVVRFQPRGGAPVEFLSEMSADPQRWTIGRPVPVAYRETQPDQAEIASTARLWLAPLVLLLLALGSFATAWKAGG